MSRQSKTNINKPNFLVIGAPKAGTTSIHFYLKQHPEIFVTDNKEPKFFSFENQDLKYAGPQKAVNQIRLTAVTDYSSYLSLFKNAGGYKAIGEVSPSYLHYAGVPERIMQYLPSVRLIAILRNPVERLYSDWKHQISMGWEPERNFKEAISKWEERERENWPPYFNYLPKGLYYDHLTRYLRYFSQQQMKVLLFEDLRSDSNLLMRDVFSFLGVDSDFSVDTSKHYMTSKPLPRNKRVSQILRPIDRLLKRLEKLHLTKNVTAIRSFLSSINQIDKEISEDTYGELIEYFREDILKLQNLIKRDLSSWLH